MRDEGERSRSQQPRRLRRGSAAVRLLGLRIRIPLEAWISACCEWCLLSGSGLRDERPFVQRSPTKNVCVCHSL